MDIYDYIEREDMTGDLAAIADDLGIEVARSIFRSWRGCIITIPSVIPQGVMCHYLQHEHAAGRPPREVARELGITDRYARKLRNAPCKRAVSLPQTHTMEGHNGSRHQSES